MHTALFLTLLAAAPVAPAAAPDALPNGAWVFGSTGEPDAGSTELPQTCWGPSQAMSLTTHGAQVTVRIDWYPGASGAAPRFNVNEFEELHGKLDGGVLVLTGDHVVAYTSAYGQRDDVGPKGSRGPVRYELRWDRRTGHLVGTRDGKPFWAAPGRPPAHALGPDRCGPPPP